MTFISTSEEMNAFEKARNLKVLELTGHNLEFVGKTKRSSRDDSVALRSESGQPGNAW